VRETRADLGDDLTKNRGENRRPAGKVAGGGVYPSSPEFTKAIDPKYAPR
jgi:hypothetical protein